MNATVSVAVVSWNTRELLAACLDSLRADHDSGLAEVWVVDNGSADGSAELVRQDFGWVRLIARDDNLGFGAAVNLVAARTTTPWVAPANADLRLEPAALTRLLAAGAEHPRAGALAPRLLTLDGSTQHSVHPFPTVALGLALSTGVARWGPVARRLPLEGHWDPDAAREVDWAHGAFLLVRREAWEAAGGFDPEQWLYAEDLDLGWRLRRAGWVTRYVPEAAIHHHVSAATAQQWSQGERLVRTQRSAYAWLARRRGLAAARAVALAHMAGPAVRWAGYAAAERIWPGRFASARDMQRGYLAAHRTGLEPAAALERHRRGR